LRVNRVGNDGNQIFHSGDSMIINPLGEIMYQQSDVEDVHTMQFNKATLNSIRTQYPFWKDADSFILTNEV
jgi:predicted amidohydrolase